LSTTAPAWFRRAWRLRKCATLRPNRGAKRSDAEATRPVGGLRRVRP
jgi:hypothetical protein